MSAGRSAVSSTATRAIKLYTNPGSRGKIPEWYLGELGLPYDPILMDMRAGDHRKPAFLAINPFGKVPALTDGDVKLFESGAILLYLAQTYAGPLRAEDMQWTLFANSTMCDAFFNASQRAQMPVVLKTLNGLLTSKKYLTGDEFAVSDVADSSSALSDLSSVSWPGAPKFNRALHQWTSPTVLPSFPRYMKDIVARPACPAPYKEAMAGAVAEVEKQNGGGGFLGKLFGGR
ncbi:MAG: hypothetical protein WDW38_005317 [Sanguina aurantia]